MATFDLGAFVAEPTSDVLDSCRKVDLLEIARHYEIPVSVTLRVGELREAVLAGLVASEVLVLPKSSNLEQGVTVGGAVASPVRLGESADSPQPPVGSPEVLFGEAEEKVRVLSPTLSVHSPRDVRLDVRLARLKNEREEKERDFQLKRELELKRIELEAATAREVEFRSRVFGES
uniref:Uncharacterized protein n=1 Tax=Knipowitschia caucasica TaxID=637954 RepID=A0AAV2KY71_KNICA